MKMSFSRSSRLSRKRKNEDSQPESSQFDITVDDFQEDGPVFRLPPKRPKPDKVSNSRGRSQKVDTDIEITKANVSKSCNSRQKENTEEVPDENKASTVKEVTDETQSKDTENRLLDFDDDSLFKKPNLTSRLRKKAKLTSNKDSDICQNDINRSNKNEIISHHFGDADIEKDKELLELEKSICTSYEKLCHCCKHIVPSSVFADHLKDCMQQKFKNNTRATRSTASTSESSEQGSKNNKEIENEAEIRKEQSETNKCQICSKVFKYPSERKGHVKGCALKHGITLEELKQATEKNKNTINQNKDNKPRKSRSKKASTSEHVKDPDLAIALALSRSLAEDEADKRSHDEEKLLALGLGEIVQEDRKERPIAVLKQPPPDKPPKGKSSKRKKGGARSETVLMQRSISERERIISEKVAMLLAADDNPTPTWDPQKNYISKHCLAAFQDQSCSLWSSSHCAEDESLDRFYVKELGTYIKPQNIEVGGLFRRLSQIPGRLNATATLEDSDSDDGYQELDVECSVAEAYRTQLILAELMGSQEGLDFTVEEHDEGGESNISQTEQSGFMFMQNKSKERESISNDSKIDMLAENIKMREDRNSISNDDGIEIEIQDNKDSPSPLHSKESILNEIAINDRIGNKTLEMNEDGNKASLPHNQTESDMNKTNKDSSLSPVKKSLTLPIIIQDTEIIDVPDDDDDDNSPKIKLDSYSNLKSGINNSPKTGWITRTKENNSMDKSKSPCTSSRNESNFKSPKSIDKPSVEKRKTKLTEAVFNDDVDNYPKQNKKDITDFNFTNLLLEEFEKNNITISNSPDKLLHSDTVLVSTNQVSNNNNKSNTGTSEVTPKRDLPLKKKPLNKKLLSTFNQVSNEDNESKIISIGSKETCSELENKIIDKTNFNSINVLSTVKLSKQILSKNSPDDTPTTMNYETVINNIKENSFQNISADKSMSPLSSSGLKATTINDETLMNNSKGNSFQNTSADKSLSPLSSWGLKATTINDETLMNNSKGNSFQNTSADKSMSPLSSSGLKATTINDETLINNSKGNSFQNTSADKSMSPLSSSGLKATTINDETIINNSKENSFQNTSADKSMSPLSSSGLKDNKNDLDNVNDILIRNSREKMKEKVMSDWGLLFENGDETDTQIITRKGKILKCHSLVILVRCKQLFTELKIIDMNSHSIKSVEWKEIPYNVAYKFIVYIYTGKCEILTKSDNMWVPLFDLAQKYKTFALLEYLESLDESIQKNNEKSREFTNELTNELVIETLDKDHMYEIDSIIQPVNKSINTAETTSHNFPVQRFTPRSSYLSISKSYKDFTAIDGSQSPDLFDEDDVDDDLFECCEVEEYSNNKTECRASSLEKTAPFKSFTHKSNYTISPQPLGKSYLHEQNERTHGILSDENKDATKPYKSPKKYKSLNISTNRNELASPTMNEKDLSLPNLASPDSEEIMEIEQSPRRKSPLSKENENENVITAQEPQSEAEKQLDNDVIDLTVGSEPESSNSSIGSPHRDITSPVRDCLNTVNDLDDTAKEIQISVECNNPVTCNSSSDVSSNHRLLSLIKDVETNGSKLKNLNISSVRKADTLSFQNTSGDVDFFDDDTEDMDPLVLGGDTSNSEADDPVIIEKNQENIEEELLGKKSHEKEKEILCEDDAVDNEINKSYIDNVWDDFDDMGMGCEMTAAYVPSPVKAPKIQEDKINSAKFKKNNSDFDRDLEMDNVEVDTEESFILKLNEDEDNNDEISSNMESVRDFRTNHTKLFKECSSNKEKSSFKLLEMDDCHFESDGNENLSGKSSVSDTTLLRAVDDAESCDWNCDLTLAEESRDLKLHPIIEKEGHKTKQKSKKDQSKTPVAPKKKTIQITPRPDYKNMVTPELKKALTKYGIRPISKNKAVQLLTHVYEQTHPVVTDSEAETSYCETPPAKPIVPVEEKKGGKKNNDNALRKRVLTKMQQSSTHSSQNEVQTKSSNKMKIPNKPSSLQSNLKEQNEEIFNSSQDSDSSDGSDNGCAEETILMPERNEEENQDDLLTATQQGDLQSRVSDFIKHDPDLRMKVLLYEPIWIRELQANMKLNGIKCSMAVLMDILDQQCVTFRSEKVQKQGKGRTRKKPK